MKLVFLAHDDIVHCGKAVRTQEIKIVPLWRFYFLAQNIEISCLRAEAI